MQIPGTTNPPVEETVFISQDEIRIGTYKIPLKPGQTAGVERLRSDTLARIGRWLIWWGVLLLWIDAFSFLYGTVRALPEWAIARLAPVLIGAVLWLVGKPVWSYGVTLSAIKWWRGRRIVLASYREVDAIRLAEAINSVTGGTEPQSIEFQLPSVQIESDRVRFGDQAIDARRIRSAASVACYVDQTKGLVQVVALAILATLISPRVIGAIDPANSIPVPVQIAIYAVVAIILYMYCFATFFTSFYAIKLRLDSEDVIIHVTPYERIALTAALDIRDRIVRPRSIQRIQV